MDTSKDIIAIPHRDPAVIWSGGTYTAEEVADLHAHLELTDTESVQRWIDDKRHQWMRVFAIADV